jgi:small-conductance mechanosensitive channel
MDLSFLQHPFLGNTLQAYGISLFTVAAAVSLIWLFKRLIISRLRALSARTTWTFDDFLVGLLDRNIVPFFFIGTVFLAVQGLHMNPVVRRVTDALLALLLTVMAVRLVLAVVGWSLEQSWKQREKDEGRRQALSLVMTGVQVVAWVVAAIIFLDNMGVKISTLVAGLGIGGVAVALASQALLGDLFSFVTIFFDRPFEIGDFIVVGEFQGTVEHIGVKTTRIRSLSGEQLIFCNTDLTSSRVRNFKRMERRRVLFSIGVTYATSTALAREIPALLRAAIETAPATQFDRAHFRTFGDFALIFEAVYFVLSSDANLAMDIQQEINLNLKEAFEKRGIEFAYPTQTVQLQGCQPGQLASASGVPGNRAAVPL